MIKPLVSANKAYNTSDSFFEDKKYNSALEGFDELWQITEDSLPSVYSDPTEKRLAEQQEQILYLSDEISLLKSENLELKQKIAEMSYRVSSYEELQENYSEIIELNRALTKQLNKVIFLREKERSQILALKAFLQ